MVKKATTTSKTNTTITTRTQQTQQAQQTHKHTQPHSPLTHKHIQPHSPHTHKHSLYINAAACRWPKCVLDGKELISLTEGFRGTWRSRTMFTFQEIGNQSSGGPMTKGLCPSSSQCHLGTGCTQVEGWARIPPLD